MNCFLKGPTRIFIFPDSARKRSEVTAFYVKCYDPNKYVRLLKHNLFISLLSVPVIFIVSTVGTHACNHSKGDLLDIRIPRLPHEYLKNKCEMHSGFYILYSSTHLSKIEQKHHNKYALWIEFEMKLIYFRSVFNFDLT